ncbi:MAG TPA: NAD(P)H-hydrate dehydratase [Bacteroidales bacterium]|nr:NAD(P)H-hydrate dehydratase [Bacteroidales bacterium]
MKIFRSEQIREIDEFTIKNEPVSSVNLMERAALQLFTWLSGRFGRSDHFIVFAGPGNNGGDGLALARMLSLNEFDVDVYSLNFTEKRSPDWIANYKRLESETGVSVRNIDSAEEFPMITSGDLVIDAIFGSGLTRNAKGLPGEVIKYINGSDNKKVISVDIPSGLFGEDNGTNDTNCIIRADYTLSFQFPKLSFMFSDNAEFTGEWFVLPIGLHKAAISGTTTDFSFTELTDIVPLLRKRKKFDHKGSYGHGLMISGSFGKMGAAVLGAGGAVRSGAGLITCHIPACGNLIMQSALPEAMVNIDNNENHISGMPDLSSYSAIGTGPGIGRNAETASAIHALLQSADKPLVIDADAINILAENREWLTLLPGRTILTPHVKEFERLTGTAANCYDRLVRQVGFSAKYNCIVVLKGAHTSISSPDGNVRFNSTGNPGMATGGSGDVLTGIILSLLTQGYDPVDAAVAGVFLHGLAGDIAAEKLSPESMIASDIINNIGEAYLRIRERVF